MRARYTLIILSILLVTGFWLMPVSAQETEGTTEYITRWDEQIEVQTDGRIRIEEHITYDFGQETRHGIVRTIPVTTKNDAGDLYRMGVNDITVTDESGAAYPFETTRQDENMRIKIGDPDKTITGVHTYVVGYRVDGGIHYFTDFDELYWDAVGAESDVPIQNIHVRLVMPQSITESMIQARCFVGAVDANNQCPVVMSGYRLDFTAENLAPREGMTIVTRFPTGIVAVMVPEKVVPFWTTIWGKLTAAVIVIVALYWYVILPIWLPFKWWRAGRDPAPQGTGAVRAWFDPPKTSEGRALTAAETGTLIDEQANIKEITATIVQLAQKGYFRIVEEKKGDFVLHKQDKSNTKSQLQDFENKFITDLFGDKKTMHIKKHSAAVQSAVDTLKSSLYKTMVANGFFPENPDDQRKRYAILSGVAAVTFNIPLLISAGIFGRIMPRKTLEGVHAFKVAQSLKDFLSSQERQLNFQGDKQLMFERLLPYAIAFGVERAWAKRFEGIDLENPDWYQSSQTSAFTAYAFSQSLKSSFQSSINSAATPVSSSGYSSGFSGGSVGGGGGGGSVGSW